LTVMNSKKCKKPKGNVGDLAQCAKKGRNFFWKRVRNTEQEVPEVPDDITTKTIRMENGIALEQTTVFYPKTREAKIQVPAHGNNSAVTVFVDHHKVVHVTPYFCQISAKPEGMDIDDIERDAFNAHTTGNRHRVANSRVVSGERHTNYHQNIEYDHVSESELRELSENIQTACKGKPFKKVRIIPIDEKTLNKFEMSKILGRQIDNSQVSNRQQSCTNLNTLCSHIGSWCWYFKPNKGYGINIDMHSVHLNYLCINCCDDETPSNICSCSGISTLDNLKTCYEQTYGCPLGTRSCNTECLEYEKQCFVNNVGECFGDDIKCGKDECTYMFDGKQQKHTCESNGEKTCINNGESCPDNCPDGTHPCGPVKCVDNLDNYHYCEKTGQCLTNDQPCDGKCVSNYILCGNECKPDSDWQKCNGACIEKHKQCNGECIVGTIPCGLSCLFGTGIWAPSLWWVCGGTCIPSAQDCNGKCKPESGRKVCGDECIKPDQNKRTCGDKCISNTKQCPSECPKCIDGYYPCGQTDCIELNCKDCNINAQNNPWYHEHYNNSGPSTSEVQFLELTTPEK